MSRRRYVATLVGLAAVYFVAGRLGLHLAFVNRSATAVWAPTGIALAAFLVLGYGFWPAVLAGAFLVNLATSGGVAISAGIATGNTLEGLLGAYLVNRFAGGRRAFERPQDVFKFAFFAGVVSTLVSATVGSTSLVAGGQASWAEYRPVWLTWWLGDMVGDFVIAPSLILWADGQRARWRGRHVAEAALLLASLLVVGGAVFDGRAPGGGSYLCIPILIWAAFRFGPRETATASLLLSAIAIRGTLRGFGPFAVNTPNESLLRLQAYMGVVTVMAIAIAVVVRRQNTADRINTQLLAELSGQRERMDKLVSTVPGVVWETWDQPDDQTQQINFVSNHVETMLGYTVEQWLSSPNFWLSIVHLEDRTRAAQEAAAIFQSGVGGVSQFRWVAKDSHVLWVEAHSVVIRNAAGQSIGTRGVTMDITDRKRAEEERALALSKEHKARLESEAANRAKDEFLATLSHELRTPLTAILGWARLLRGESDPETVAGGLEKIERNAKAQAKLIDDILDVSRIITGKLRLEFRPVDVSSVVEAALESVRPAADANNIRISAHLDREAGFAAGDANRLQQVAWNLLSNAVKFSPKGGRVEVSLRRVDSHIELSVKDNGKGITAEFLPRVFDRFLQADGSTTRAHGGLGLGLAIVRHIVELHGGGVRAESPGEGHGATFTVMLPRAGTSAQIRGSTAGRRGASHPELQGLRVLVVDDDRDTRVLLAAILQSCGVAVTEAESVRNALHILRSSPLDLLISDIAMPGESGFALIRQLRSLAPEEGGSIPAIALTGYASLDERVRVLAAGFQAHVPKPVEPDEFLTLVATMAGQGRTA